MNAAGASASTGRILYLGRVPYSHAQYSAGRTSERRALVVWIKLSITDTESEGTIPTPGLNAFTQQILTGAYFSRGITLHWARRVLRGPAHTPLLLQLASWGEPKVLHAIKGMSDPGRISFITSPSLRVPRPPTSFAARQDIKSDKLLTLRHVIFLFRASLQTLGPSREHERDDGGSTRSSGPCNLTFPTDRADHWSLLFTGRDTSRPQPECSIPRNRGTHRFYMFSFLDTRKARNRLRWIGKTQKMVGTSGNSFMALTAYSLAPTGTVLRAA